MFLHAHNFTRILFFVYFRKRGKCSYCETPFGEKLKAHLPCAHKICLKCFADIKAKRTMKCPNCQKQIPSSYKPCNSSAEQRWGNSCISHVHFLCKICGDNFQYEKFQLSLRNNHLQFVHCLWCCENKIF